MNAFIHWLHLMGAVIWVGGMIFAGWMMTPVARRDLPPGFRAVFHRKIGRRFYAFAWCALAVTLATGVLKLGSVGGTPEFIASAPGKALLIKFGLVGLMLVLSALHDFRWGPRLRDSADAMDEPAYEKDARRIAFWARLNVAAALSIVYLGAWLRVNAGS